MTFLIYGKANSEASTYFRQSVPGCVCECDKEKGSEIEKEGDREKDLFAKSKFLYFCIIF